MGDLRFEKEPGKQLDLKVETKGTSGAVTGQKLSMSREITQQHLKEENTKNNQRLIKQLKILYPVLADTDQVLDIVADRILKKLLQTL